MHIRKFLSLALISAVAVVGAFVAFSGPTTPAVANHGVVSSGFQFTRLGTNNELPTAAMGLWRPAAGSAIGAHVYCFNSNSYPVWGASDMLNEAADEWEDAVPGNDIEVIRTPDCPGALDNTALHNTCHDNDNVSEVHIIYVTPAAWAACTNTANYNTTTGEMFVVDIVFNMAANVWCEAGESTIGCDTFRDVAIHELGHAFGLGHPERDAFTNQYVACAGVAVMCNYASFYNCLRYDTCDGPTIYDVAGIMALYHDTDNDGCRGIEEMWLNHSKETPGYDLSDNNWHDFMDTAGAVGGGGNGTINVADLTIEAEGFGTYTGFPYKDFPTNGQISSVDMQRLAGQQGFTCTTFPTGY